jgi:holo-[acyl-carrier protein] synthase
MRTGLTKHGEAFVKKIFTPQEIALCQRYYNAVEHYAGKFAVKEAFMKAIGTGMQGITFQAIEVLNRASGAPYIVRQGQVAELLDQSAIKHLHVSLSHTAHIAVAVVVLEQ